MRAWLLIALVAFVLALVVPELVITVVVLGFVLAWVGRRILRPARSGARR